MTIIRRKSDGKRLCQDGKLRDFACFGTFGSCVKVYKNVGSATKKAERLTGQTFGPEKQVSGKQVSEFEAFTVPVGHSMNAAGQISAD